MQLFPFLPFGVLPCVPVLRVGHDVQPLNRWLLQHRVPTDADGLGRNLYVVNPAPAVSKVARTFAILFTNSLRFSFGSLRAWRFE